jgi:SAM-dependent methyltransferase
MRQDLYHDLYVKEQDYWWHSGKRAIVYTLLERYLPRARDRHSSKALDLGCGTGLNLDHLARYACPVGTDYSEEALRFCRERGHKLLCKADAGSLPFADSQFDIITALDVIEHLDDDHAAFHEIRRVLVPGGLLLVSVPAFPVLWTYWDDILGHRRRYTAANLSKALQHAGLTVRKVSYSNALILAPVIAVRAMKTILHRTTEARNGSHDPSTDFLPVPRWLNRVLARYYRGEARFLARWGLPLGLSVICVAQRPEAEIGAQGSIEKDD